MIPFILNLAIFGALIYLITTFISMPGTLKRIIIGFAAFVMVIWIAQFFGISTGITIPMLLH